MNDGSCLGSDATNATWCEPVRHKRSRLHPRRRPNLALRITCVAAAALIASCASAPKPAEPDGSARVPVNDPGRVARIKELTGLESVAVQERSMLSGEVSALRGQVQELRELIKTLLINPELRGAAQAPAPQGAPAAAVKPGAVAPPISQAKPVMPTAVLATAPAGLPEASVAAAGLDGKAFEVTPTGAVFRIFFASGQSTFDASPPMRKAMLQAARDASSVVVWAYTDSSVIDAPNTRIAQERAAGAYRYLIAGGVKSTVLRARYSSCCGFIADNNTAEGKNTNRRVEIRTTGDATAALAELKKG